MLFSNPMADQPSGGWHSAVGATVIPSPNHPGAVQLALDPLPLRPRKRHTRSATSLSGIWRRRSDFSLASRNLTIRGCR